MSPDDRRNRRLLDDRASLPRLTFFVLRSPFFVLRSSFSVLRSSFFVLRSIEVLRSARTSADAGHTCPRRTLHRVNPQRRRAPNRIRRAQVPACPTSPPA